MGLGMGAANIFGAVVMLVFNTLLLRYGGESGAFYVAIYGVIYESAQFRQAYLKVHREHSQR